MGPDSGPASAAGQARGAAGQARGAADRARGALYGLAIGDALGMPTQSLPRADIAARYGPVLAGVSTDCCVLSTALAAADAGVTVQVVADACAGASDQSQQQALDIMRLYAPLIEVVTLADVLDA